MSDMQYHIERDSHNRLVAEVSDDLVVGIKILAETDPRRFEKGVHGYAVLDIRTEFGPLRIRDIKIMWSSDHERYFVRWRQWFTGKFRDGKKEFLDVAGPQDRDTRRKFEEVIIDVFGQVREQAARGTLARSGENAERLERVKEALEEREPEPEDDKGEAPALT